MRENVAVVVVTYHSDQVLPGLLDSLEPAMAGLSWQLTIADNSADPGALAALRRMAPTARIVDLGRNAGYAAGINAAVAASGAYTAILVLNPDIRLAPRCGPELLAVLRRTGAGIAVPRLERADGSAIASLRREPTLLRALGDAVLGGHRAGRLAVGELVLGDEAYRSESRADWASGAAMLISAECWRRCGPWDETFFLYAEETEFALRARDAGLATVLAPAARAVHLEGESKRSPRLWTLLTLNRIRLYRRRHRLGAVLAYWAAVLLREAIRAARGNPASRAAVAALLRPSRLREAPGPPAG
ncbi:glycosyltransferase [Plantactinospora siamensis]|uniref:Glycosyltransferase n=1 Tax=Plantactinospora siamensis TaxID=555372 RepID=A0ABV6NXS2_9ACTN